jgi:hypothetical protein
MRIVPVTATSDRKTVTSTSAQFDTTMAAGEFYVFTTTVAAYIKQGANPVTATAADASVLIGPGQSCLIDGGIAAKLAVLRATEDGEATLTRAKIG